MSPGAVHRSGVSYWWVSFWNSSRVGHPAAIQRTSVSRDQRSDREPTTIGVGSFPSACIRPIVLVDVFNLRATSAASIVSGGSLLMAFVGSGISLLLGMTTLVCGAVRPAGNGQGRRHRVPPATASQPD